MMKNILSVVTAAVLLAMVSATPCTDICLGSCEVAAESSRIWVPYFEAFVQPNLDACRSVCVATCNCVDSCGAQCGAQLSACRSVPEMNFFHYVQCQFEFAACQMVCATQCTLSTTAGIVDRMIKTVLPPLE